MSNRSLIAIDWIEKLESRGIKKFRFAELPEDLKNKRALINASESGLIKKIEKSPNALTTWEIRPFKKLSKVRYIQ